MPICKIFYILFQGTDLDHIVISFLLEFLAKNHIVLEGFGKDEWLLFYIGDYSFVAIFPCEVLHLMEKGVEESGLPGSYFTYDGCELPLWDLEIDILERVD